jgi:hypothetical protein
VGVILETQKLISSNYRPLRELGWLLYNSDLPNPDFIDKLVKIFNESTLEKIEQSGYDEGLNDGYTGWNGSK